MDVTNFFSVGERILFLPVIIFLALIAAGLILFVAVSLVVFIVHLPITLFNHSFRESRGDDSFEKKLAANHKLTKKDLYLSFLSGNWIVWVAALPLVIAVFAVVYLFFSSIFS